MTNEKKVCSSVQRRAALPICCEFKSLTVFVLLYIFLFNHWAQFYSFIGSFPNSALELLISSILVILNFCC